MVSVPGPSYWILLDELLNCSGPYHHLHKITSLANLITRWESGYKRTLKGCERAYKVILFLIPSTLTTVKYYEKNCVIWRYKAVSPPGPVCFSQMISIKILLRESERKMIQICNVFILLPFSDSHLKAHIHLGLYYQLSSLAHI